jgi:hypothetical protein
MSFNSGVERQSTALLVGNFGRNLLHLHETHRRRGMRLGEADAVATEQGHRAPHLFGAGKLVARARGVIGADIVGLAVEADAERFRPGLLKFAGEDAAG